MNKQSTTSQNAKQCKAQHSKSKAAAAAAAAAGTAGTAAGSAAGTAAGAATAAAATAAAAEELILRFLACPSADSLYCLTQKLILRGSPQLAFACPAAQS